MGRSSLKAVRQKEIILAFYNVSKKVGLENASIAKVAESLNMNPSLILHYFQTREALLAGLISFILERYSAIYRTNGGTYSTKEELIQLIDNLFSRKWDKLFDDSVFYSCYAMTYRDRKLRLSFKLLHDSLRALLVEALVAAKKNKVIDIDDEEEIAQVIFALVEGAYYYLGMVSVKKENEKKLSMLKKQALLLLGIHEH